MAVVPSQCDPSPEFGRLLADTRSRASLSPRKLARSSGLATSRITELESGATLPTDRELGALAQAFGVAVFDLLPPGYGLRVLVHDGPRRVEEARGIDALDALMREYLSMVVELRSGRAVTAPTLRHEDVVLLARSLGDTPEAIEARLVALLEVS
jgi:transcriptional regulator with XRE-family HTH domain